MTRQCKECRAKTIEDLRKAIRSVVSDMQISNETLERENNLLKKISTFLTDNQLFSLRELKQENKKLKEKLEKIKELCQIPNEPYYNSECEFGKGRIDLGQEILEIIRGEE